MTERRFALRLAAGCALLVGLALTQDPGFLVADTKFDLVADPGGFLLRAVHLWDGEGAFGQLQNQAYGYLWPTGPFFWAGVAAAIPGWVVQRLWWGLVLSVAFVGVARVARALGVRSDLACLLAGAAYAVSPRVLSTMGPISSETWAVALAPWVLLPLVVGASTGSPRRAAARSAVAVAMVGGVNAAATFAVLPLGAVWLLTRRGGRRRRSLMFWWPVFTLLGTLWWLVPLFVMGSVSPPFLDWIESASVTTFPTTVLDTLWGTSDWVPYVDTGARAGRDLLTTPYLALDAGVLLVLGLAGMMLPRRGPAGAHRWFLGLSLLLGLLLVRLGHTGPVQGWGAEDLHAMLDAALSPIRNVHKFDPVVRLPLALGLAITVEAAVESARRGLEGRRGRPDAAVVVVTAVLVVAASAVPLLAGRIAPASPVLGVPSYWQQTADWLAENPGSDGDATALLVPGSAFARYQWGSPDDEPLQWLADSRWAVRNVVPLVPAGNIRALDGIEDRLAQGRGSRGLAAALERAGVHYVVVRNDLVRDPDVPDPVLVQQALLASPGLLAVAAFGPQVGGAAHLQGSGSRVVVGGGWQTELPAVEIWEVGGAERTVAAEDVPLVVGGPEDLPDLVDLGVLDERPALLAADAPDPLPAQLADGPLVLTDGLRAREHAFARTHDADSPVITPGDVRHNGNPTRDYLLDTGDRWSTTARLVGARSVSASSSAADTDSLAAIRRGTLPYAALDGSYRSAWSTAPFVGGTGWWRVDLDAPLHVSAVTLVGGSEADPDQTVVVSTEQGSSEPVQVGPRERVRVDVPVGMTTWVRVGSATEGRSLTLAEVQAPGLSVRRVLALPEVPPDWGTPDAIVLRADRDARTGCAEVTDVERDRTEVRCSTGREVPDEEATGLDRLVTLAAPATYDDLQLRARPRAGSALEDLVLQGQALRVSASTVGVDDPRASALAAVDGDPGTAWLADPDDVTPTLGLRWVGEREVSALRFRLDPDTAAKRPLEVRLVWPGGSRTVDVVDGRVQLDDPILTDRLDIEVVAAEPVSDVGFDQVAHPVGVGIGEVRLRGVPYEPLRLSLDPARTRCGTGPALVVGSTTWPTRVVASPAQLARGLAVEVRPCGRESRRTTGVTLGAGATEIRLEDAPAFEATSVVLGSLPEGAAPTALATRVSSDSRVIASPPAGARIVVSRENTNAGWSAEQDGRALVPIVLDGWQQGWLLPDDPSVTGPVVARFGPDAGYRVGLLVGMLTLALLLLGTLLAALRRRTPPATDPLLPRRPGSVATAVAGVLAGGLVAGTPGAGLALALAVLVVAGRRLLGRDRARSLAAPLAWLLALPVLGAATAYALGPWASATTTWAGQLAWPDYLALVPVVSVLLLATEPPRRRSSQVSGWRPFRRSAGRSTSR